MVMCVCPIFSAREPEDRCLGQRPRVSTSRSFRPFVRLPALSFGPIPRRDRRRTADETAGKELLKFANDETTIAQLKDRIAKTIDYLKSVKQSEIDGTEDKDISITFPSGQTRQFTGQSLLLGYSLPNFWFHTTTAYDIVRQCGVEVGKRDFMGMPPAS